MTDYSTVTEIGDADVTSAQIERVIQRYYWAGEYCKNKDVLEIACGAGQGLGYLNDISKTLKAGDITPSLVRFAKNHYKNRIDITEMNANNLPFEDGVLDVVILFEAVYYLDDINDFLNECKRVLRKNGNILLATANKDLYGFNPSPFSKKYYNPEELNKLMSTHGFESIFYGGSPVSSGLLAKLIYISKKIAVKFNLVPKTMKGKKWLKRIFFGKLVKMPVEIDAGIDGYTAPVPIKNNTPDTLHQVLYCCATKR